MKPNLIHKLILLCLVSGVPVGGFALVAQASGDQLVQQEAKCKSEISALLTKYKGRSTEARSELDLAYFRLGNIQSEQGKYAEAKQSYLKSDEESSDGNGSSTNAQSIAECSCRLGQFADAEKYYGKALAEAKYVAELNHQDMTLGLASVLLGLGNVYEQTNRSQEAERTYRDVAAKVEKMEADKTQRIASPRSFDQLAALLAARGETNEAEHWWQKVVNMRASAHAYSEQADALEHYAAMLVQQKKSSEAAPLLKRAKELRQTQEKMNKSGLDY